MNQKRNVAIIVMVIIILALGLYIVTRKPVTVDNYVAVPAETKNEHNASTDSLSQQPSTAQVPACNINYSKTVESKVVAEESPAFITEVEKKCDGNYYVTVDYLGSRQGNPEAGGSYFTNTNLALRTFRVGHTFQVSLAGNEQGSNTAIDTYLSQIKKTTSQQSYLGRDTVYMRTGAPSSVYQIKVQNGSVSQLNEVYLP